MISAKPFYEREIPRRLKNVPHRYANFIANGYEIWLACELEAAWRMMLEACKARDYPVLQGETARRRFCGRYMGQMAALRRWNNAFGGEARP